MKETEVTVEVKESYETLKQKLTSQGFSCSKTFTMLDRYYSQISMERLQNRSFEQIISNSFLLRAINSKTDKDEDEINILLYKDKIFDEQGNVIEEEKVQTYIDNAEKHAEIFARAGFKPYATIFSSNELLSNGKFELLIQNVENLGLFIEFEEYDEIKHLSPKEKSSKLISVLKGLGLNLGDDFNCKKLNLYIKQNNSPEPN